jgi:hypothetical protein
MGNFKVGTKQGSNHRSIPQGGMRAKSGRRMALPSSGGKGKIAAGHVKAA